MKHTVLITGVILVVGLIANGVLLNHYYKSKKVWAVLSKAPKE